MPELPEVETVRLGLNQVTCGPKIVGGEVLLGRTIAFPPEATGFIPGLMGCVIHNWERRGKYLLAELRKADALTTLASGGWWGVHLRMTGQLLWVSPQEPVHKHTRVRVWFQDPAQAQFELRFVDTRTFGQMWWVPPTQARETVVTGLQKLGPEPFSEDFSVGYLRDRLKLTHRPIKNALLDQRLVAGVGNIYADESLFLSGIRPTCPSDRLSAAKVAKLREAIIQVLRDSIGAGGTTFSDFRSVEGINGNYGAAAWVYNRTGEPCRTCGSLIERTKLAGRSAHFCPSCQNIGAP